MRITNKILIVFILCLSCTNFTHIHLKGNANDTINNSPSSLTKINPAMEFVLLNNKSLLFSNPLLINDSSEFLNTAHSRGWNGNGTKNNPFIIENIFFSDRLFAPSQIDISIKNTDFYFTIQNIYLEFLRLTNQPVIRTGIRLENCSNILIRNVFFMSAINNNNAHMISILNSSQVKIEQNYFSTQRSYALELSHSDQINISSNFFKTNFVGVLLGLDCFNVSISNNNFQGNTKAIENTKNNFFQIFSYDNSIFANHFENNSLSINIFGGNFGIIHNNTFLDLNFQGEGIYLKRSINTVINDNFFIGFELGVEIDQIQNTTFSTSACAASNTIPECFELDNASSSSFTLHQSNVTISRNEFLNQKQTSILIHNYTDGNIIKENNFINTLINSSKALVQIGFGQNTTNYFSENGYGNYWSNYNGTDTNNNGIGDEPYYINQKLSDSNPLIRPINISKPLINVANESSYSDRLQISVSIGTTSIEVGITGPVPSFQQPEVGNTGETGGGTKENFFKILAIIGAGSIAIAIITSIGGIIFLGLVVVNEYRKSDKSTISISFRKHLKEKIKKLIKKTEEKKLLSDNVFEELEEIINENKLGKN